MIINLVFFSLITKMVVIIKKTDLEINLELNKNHFYSVQ